jgi:hypothetical protein
MNNKNDDYFEGFFIRVTGADFDFLIGSSGAKVPKDSH